MRHHFDRTAEGRQLDVADADAMYVAGLDLEASALAAPFPTAVSIPEFNDATP